MSAKQQILNAVMAMDDDATWDKILEDLEVAGALDESIRDAENGRLIPHDEVMKVFERCPKNTK